MPKEKDNMILYGTIIAAIIILSLLLTKSFPSGPEIKETKVLFELLDKDGNVIESGTSSTSNIPIQAFEGIDPSLVSTTIKGLPVDLSNPEAVSLRITFIVANTGDENISIEFIEGFAGGTTK